MQGSITRAQLLAAVKRCPDGLRRLAEFEGLNVTDFTPEQIAEAIISHFMRQALGS